MLTSDIRKKFLKYFKDKEHAIVPSSPVVPHDDPTLLFTNAGMNQFKDVFLGKSNRDYTRAVTSQKCIRVGGKHNDLENVGHTRRHLTFFEMLGNFSFGDYFKKEAIQFAWEISTNVYGFDPERIFPTVFHEDEEAFELWTKYVPAERITRFEAKTNFWAMGDTGPCGPCSELLYDRGPKFGSARNPKEDVTEERFLEFWNLVFMQYNRDESGVLIPLPKPSIDTGAGLERIVDLKIDAFSVYDTDVLRSLISRVEEITGVAYNSADTRAPAFRVIADHLRCLAFAIADGVQPSNTDRGYVLRKVLRRAVRYGRQLNMDRPFLADIMPRLIETMGDDYPELKKSETRIEEILNVEEEAFIRTLHRGGNILNQIMEHAHSKDKKISGHDAFKLKDTYGFPLEEILLIAKDANLQVDTDHYQHLELEAKEKSRKVHKSTKQMAEESLFANYAQEHGSTSFLGYDQTSTEAKVTALLIDNAFVNEIPAGAEGIVILDQSPFYAEKGGQIGDFGILENKSTSFKVTDTQSPFKGVIAHVGKLENGTLKLGDKLTASIDNARRQKIANNHTATHLMHWALYEVLGEHVKQAGSVVDQQKLRFDFSHHKALTPLEIRKIEDLVNAKVRENTLVEWYEIPYEEAQKLSEIKQFFGDKYDSKVRVIDIEYSKELCGGTHTSRTGNIGLFRIAKEGSIAAGVRRIEAVTGEDAEALWHHNDDLLLSLSDKLKTEPSKIDQRLEKLLEENKALTLELKNAKKGQLGDMINELLKKVEIINGTPILASVIDLPPDEMRTLADSLFEKMTSGVLVLGAGSGDKCNLIVRVTQDLIGKGIKAGEIIKTIAPIVEGGGGGKADSAQAGGKNPAKLSEAIAKAKELV
jgi:alanyl-tRNA synthetase